MNTMRMMLIWGAVAVFVPRMAPAICVGDCNDNASVSVDELIRGVNISLGSTELSACPQMDASGDGQITVNELVTAVNNALNGCSVEPPTGLQAKRVTTAPTGIDDPIWEAQSIRAPALTNVSTNLLYGDGQLNMSGTFSGATDFNGGQPAELELRAVHDGDQIYILAEWNDDQLNIDRRRWLFNGPTDPLKPGESAAGWTSQLNDDKIGFAFEVEAASSVFGTFPTVGCAAACHNVESGLDMRPGQGKVDIWFWKTSRSEPLGYAADQLTTPDAGRRDDAGTSIEHRNVPSGGNNRSGPSLEWDGTVQTFERWDGRMVDLDPAYFILDGHSVPFTGDAVAGDVTYQTACAACHGNAGQGGIGPALTKPEFTRDTRAELDSEMASSSHPGSFSYTPLNADARANLIARLRGFSGIPGYYLTPPAGSVGDIVTDSNVDVSVIGNVTRTHYRVMFVRTLNTGNADDAQFAAGGQYVFGVGLMDNDGRNHIGAQRELLTLAP